MKNYNSFSHHKQTYKELTKLNKISVKTVQKYLDMKTIVVNKPKPRKIVLLIDTTYFWTFGLMLFKDAKEKDILNYKIVDQKQIIKRYVTKKPVLGPNKELNEIVKWLHKTDKWTFESMIEKWYEKYRNWLNEKWIGQRWKRYYIHKKTRSAYLSLKRNLKYLFTYLDLYWKVDIPNTTNAIESVFSHIKYKVNLYRWLRKDRKIKLILNLLKV